MPNFDGQPAWVRYLWELGRKTGEVVGQNVTRCRVDDLDRFLFPELEGVETVDLWQSRYGFVVGMA